MTRDQRILAWAAGAVIVVILCALTHQGFPAALQPMVFMPKRDNGA